MAIERKGERDIHPLTEFRNKIRSLIFSYVARIQYTDCPSQERDRVRILISSRQIEIRTVSRDVLRSGFVRSGTRRAVR